MADFALALMLGYGLDLLLGDPAWLTHPVCLIGRYIAWCEERLRRGGGEKPVRRRPERKSGTAEAETIQEGERIG